MKRDVVRKGVLTLTALSFIFGLRCLTTCLEVIGYSQKESFYGKTRFFPARTLCTAKAGSY